MCCIHFLESCINREARVIIQSFQWSSVLWVVSHYIPKNFLI
ncbi:hypothetical protein ABH11_03051 [Serratia marcescens]|nr:hypothetical protein ABH11_03051 [Serratia marcescens]CVG26933.1 Uncharacterised protein [Serratia marcescens]